jgi:hypothetical protein
MIWTQWIDVEIDNLDATLPPRMAVAALPLPLPKLSAPDLGKQETPPLAARRQSRSALSTKLICERLLLTVGVPKHMRAKLARMSFIQADDLLALDNRSLE